MIFAEAPVETFAEIDSTQAEARRRAAAGDFGPVWITAERQSAGHGRRGRAWASRAGNLMFTYLASTPRAPAEIALFGFAAGVALAECIDAVVGAGRVTLKWPNDVLIDGAKVSGLLIDSGAAGSGLNWLALGVGVNLAVAPDGLDQRTTSVLDVAGEAAPPLVFLSALRNRLAFWDETFATESFAPLRAAWLSRAHGLGAPARVIVGDATVEGRIAGLSPRGELELETPDGRRAIAAGDVFFPDLMSV